MHFLSLLVALLVAHTTAAQNRTSEQGEAQITDPAAECTPYDYPPVGEAVAAGQFPPAGAPASIVTNDTNAAEKWQSIQSLIPNIQPNGNQPGSLSGDFSGFTYPGNDPDCWWTYYQCTTPKAPGLPPDIVVVPEPGTLGYGFDDGPNCGHNVFYDFLQQNDQKATMFYIGTNILDWPLEAQRALTDGHEICTPGLTTTVGTLDARLRNFTIMQLIKLVAGVTPTCWRPPYGDVDDRIRAIAHALGLRTIIWSYDSNDWRAGSNGFNDSTVDGIYQGLINQAQSGGFNTEGTIMLTHELNNFTMSEAIKFYGPLKSAFQHIVPVGVAINQTKPYVEANYSLPSFEQYVAGTTTIEPTVVMPTSTPGPSSESGSTGSSGHASSGNGSGTSGASPSFSAFGGLAVSAMFVGCILRWLM